MIRQVFHTGGEFVRDVRSEMSKATYPARSETFGTTTVVIVFSLIVSLFLALVDTVLIRLIRIIL